MRFIISVLLIAALSFAACLYLPWWVIAVVGFAVAVAIPIGAGKSFLAGFTALFFLWGALCFILSSANKDMLAHKVSVMILKVDNPFLLMIVTALIGGIVAGLGSLAGGLLRTDKARAV
jgi:hypothetical protein